MHKIRIVAAVLFLSLSFGVFAKQAKQAEVMPLPTPEQQVIQQLNEVNKHLRTLNEINKSIKTLNESVQQLSEEIGNK